MKNTIKTLAPLALTLLLTACPSHTPPSQWQPAKQAQNFTATGRLSVKQNDKGSYGNFDWTRTPAVETININTPLGNTIGQLCQDPQGVIATDANGKTYQAATPEQLSQQLLGYQIPIQYLHTWATGGYLPNHPHSTEADGSLNQLGWNISRTTNPNGSPRTLQLKNNQLTIRMVISDIAPTSDTPAHCTARQI